MPYDLLDSELFGVTIEQVNIPGFINYIPFQSLVDDLYIDLIPAAK